jgi:hypothetical protein
MDAVQREIMEEKAQSLARTERRVLHALAAYRTENVHRTPGPSADIDWDLVDAVTALVVQREACGLGDSKYLFEFYGVPAEIVARIGVRRPPSRRRAGSG